MIYIKRVLLILIFLALFTLNACKEKRWDRPIYNLKSSPLPFDSIEDTSKVLNEELNHEVFEREGTLNNIGQEQAPTFEVSPPLPTELVTEQEEVKSPSKPTSISKNTEENLPLLAGPKATAADLAPMPLIAETQLQPPLQSELPPPPPPPIDDGPFGPGFAIGPFHAPFSICGNGIVEPREQCDDGNPDNYDGCNVICRLPLCGNGLRELFEECDDGNFENNDGCTVDCIFERCGNGRIEFEEQCDDGNKKPGDGCSPCCRFERCGNSIVDPYEQCDDGNTDNTDFCDNWCKFVKPVEEDPEDETLLDNNDIAGEKLDQQNHDVN